jgi:hypothetical protein
LRDSLKDARMLIDGRRIALDAGQAARRFGVRELSRLPPASVA